MKAKPKPLTLEWINSIPKTISATGCWIPINKARNGDGYCSIQVGSKQYLLHRLSMSIYLGLDYSGDFVTRHGKECSPACFDYMHLTPGTCMENSIDTINFGRHWGASKTNCPKCGGIYKKVRKQVLSGKTTWQRRCLICHNRSTRDRRARLREAKNSSKLIGS